MSDTEIYERFSDDIRHAMVLANREAKRRFHSQIDTHHLLVALVREPTGLAGIILRHRSVSKLRIRRAARRVIPRGSNLSFFRKLPLTPDLENIVTFAIRHALKEQHDSVGTGGMLLSMLNHDTWATMLLQHLSIDTAELNDYLSRHLHRHMVENPGEVLDLAPFESNR